MRARPRTLLLGILLLLLVALVPLRRRGSQPSAPEPPPSVEVGQDGHAGRVTDANGRPLAGASVEALWIGTNDAPRTIASAITDPHGLYALSPQRPPGAEGVLLLRASARGHAMDGRVVERAGTRQDFVLVERSSAVLVRITDATGATVDGAEVVVALEQPSAGPSALVVVSGTSDRAGEASFTGFPAVGGELHWSVVARGLGAAHGTVPAPARDELVRVDARLDGGVRLSGIVVDEQGRAVSAVALRLSQTEGPWSDEARSDATGAFALDHVPRGQLVVEALEDWRLASEARLVVEPRPGEALAEVRVVVAPGARIEGRVATARGEPVVGAEIVAHPTDGEGVRVLAASGPDGSFVVRGLRAGTRWTVEARRRESAPSFVEGVAAGTRDLAIVLGAGGALVGAVRDDEARPVAGVEVYVHRMRRDASTLVATPEYRFVRTGEDGRYRAEHLGPGEYRVEVKAPAMPWSDTASRVAFATVVEGGTVEAPTATVQRPGTIRGVVRASDGAPPRALALAFLPAGSAGAPHRKAVTCGADGSFVVGDLEPGTYAVTAHDAERGFVTLPSVRVEPGRKTEVELSFEARHAIEGSVRDAAGRPVAGARVDVFAASAGSQATRELPGRSPDNFTGNSGESGADGSFVVRGLSRGTFRVRVSRPGLPPLAADVAVPSEAPLAFVLPAPSRLVVRLEGERQARANRAVLVTTRDGAGFDQEAITDADGVAKLEGLPPGRYRVRAVVQGAADVETSVGAGESRNVVLTIEKKEAS